MGTVGWRYYERDEIVFREYPPDPALIDLRTTSKHRYEFLGDEDQLRFEMWILSMRGGWGETGMGFQGKLSWLYRAAEHYDPNKPWTTIVAFERSNNRILGTASFTKPVDEFDKGAFGVLDFVNVSLELHGHGIGSLLCREIDDHIQRETNKRRKDQVVNLLTMNESANRIYGRLGYRASGQPFRTPGRPVGHMMAKTFKPVKIS